MNKGSTIILFHQKQVRRHWDDAKERWYFSIIDVVAILTGSSNPKRYWSTLRMQMLYGWKIGRNNLDKDEFEQHGLDRLHVLNVNKNN